MAFIPTWPDDAALPHMFKTYPTTSRPLLQLHEALLRKATALSAKEKEFIAAYTSALNNCNYCYGIHKQTAESYGVDGNALDAIIRDLNSAEIPEKLKVLLGYIGKLTTKPMTITKDDAENVLAAGWNEEQFYEAVAVCSLFNLMNRLVAGLGIDREDEYLSMAGERLHEIGYQGLIDWLKI